MPKGKKLAPAGDQVKYTAVPKGEGSLEDSIYLENPTPRPFLRGFCNSPLITIFNLFLFLVSLIILFNSSNPITRPNWAFEQTSYYSPLFRRMKIPVVEKVVQGTLFNEENLILRSYPSPEVDAAWEAITDVGVVIITGEEVSKLGKNPTQTVKAPLGWGHGDDAHLAQLDGQHALHCLNAVRRYAYREYYYPAVQTSNTSRSKSSPYEPFDQAHLSHCLHVLLQTLRCDFSADVITHNWMDTQDYPFPDFAIHKKCKDHDKIVDWQTKHRISQEQWMEMGTTGVQKGDYIKQLPPMMKHWVEHGEEDGQTGHRD